MNRDHDSFSVERPPPISEPTRELIRFPEEAENKLNYSQEQEKNIIVGSMSVPFHLMQAKIPTLEKLSESEILEIFTKNLKNPTEAHFSDVNEVEIPFSVDEQIELYQFLKSDFSFDEIFSLCPSLLPFRTIKSIKEEIERIKNLTQEEKEELINEATSKILNEELSFLAFSDESETREYKQFACKFRDYSIEGSIGDVSQSANEEIQQLKPLADLFLESAIDNSNLAILRNESFTFSIKKIRTVIGRPLKTAGLVDIDLSFINGFDCSHVSRVQCVLSLLEDFEFYLENTGKFSIRVNGVRIPPGKACRLKNGCIIDIFGALLAFYPNTKLITQMKEDIERKKQRSQKTKSKK